MSTGSLMAIMGMSYVALPIDLVPDFIPIFGGIDDSIAKLTAGGGLMMAYMGYTAGHGNVPGEFQIVVTVISTVYGVVMPIFRNKIVPLMVPVVKAVAVPMKVAANFILGVIVAKVQDPNSTTTLVEMAGRQEL